MLTAATAVVCETFAVYDGDLRVFAHILPLSFSGLEEAYQTPGHGGAIIRR